MLDDVMELSLFIKDKNGIVDVWMCMYTYVFREREGWRKANIADY